jgi:hypothetical protein
VRASRRHSFWSRSRRSSSCAVMATSSQGGVTLKPAQRQIRYQGRTITRTHVRMLPPLAGQLDRRTIRSGLTESANPEASLPGHRFDRHIHARHACPRWPVAAPVDHFRHGGLRAFEHRFHPSIRAVADPPGHFPAGSLPTATLAEPDALHPSTDPNVAPNRDHRA